MVEVGELVGVGRVSQVFAYGADAVVKVPSPNVPDDWPEFEATMCRAANESGLPSPEVRDLVTVNNRPAVVFTRIYGPSMWQQMLQRPDQIESLAAELARLQRMVHAVGLPPGVPDFVDRLTRRIDQVEALDSIARVEGRQMTAELPRGAALLHGDLHPGNVLMGPTGPIAIDWFDAAIGHPVADIVRSSILMRPGPRQHGHLPGATGPIVERLHSAYVAQFRDELAAQEVNLAAWQAVVASGRLAEGAEVDDHRLLELWAEREGPHPPVGLAPAVAASTS